MAMAHEHPRGGIVVLVLIRQRRSNLGAGGGQALRRPHDLADGRPDHRNDLLSPPHQIVGGDRHVHVIPMRLPARGRRSVHHLQHRRQLAATSIGSGPSTILRRRPEVAGRHTTGALPLQPPTAPLSTRRIRRAERTHRHRLTSHRSSTTIHVAHRSGRRRVLSSAASAARN